MIQQKEVPLLASLREYYSLMTPARRRQFYLVLALMMLGALAEFAAVGAVLPFLALLADPASAEQMLGLSGLFELLGAITPSEKLIAAAGLFALLALTAAAIRLQLTWSSQSFIHRLGHDYLMEIQRRLLLQPYTFHLNQNTSSLIASMDKVESLVFNVLLQLMQAAIAAFISIFIVAALVYVDPFTAAVAGACFALIYIAVSVATRRRLQRNSRALGEAYDQRFQMVQESLGGIRDIIIDGSQSAVLESFRHLNDRTVTAKANTAFIGGAPRFVIEATGMVVIAALAIVIWSREGGIAGSLPILGALALGAQRLLPLLQQIYLGWSNATGHWSLVGQTLALLRLPSATVDTPDSPVVPLPMKHGLKMEQVRFCYGHRATPTLADINLEIPRGSRVALVGRTGSGKSTLGDLLMGLLDPSEGRITIDGVPLTSKNRVRWQRNIAHVPQSIFLADTSIARNIAFGARPEAIDLRRVAEAAAKAQLDDFVSGLPDGYETLVGERGVRLSGGQRQRLGIARAIYKQSCVLVLDEATSALDDETERAVISALDSLGDEGRTIIMIAHRLSTLAGCDLVIRLDKGRLVEFGRPNRL